jgi:hypothetical protein
MLCSAVPLFVTKPGRQAVLIEVLLGFLNFFHANDGIYVYHEK